jgi:hypothetical protein
MRTKFKPVQVTVTGQDVEAKRIFTSQQKLTIFLKFINKYYKETKVELKEYLLN